MIERFFETIELPITIEQFHKLPYNAAYKYEYFGDRAWLTPRPKFSHAVLCLRDRSVVPDEIDAPEAVRVRPLRDGDWDLLAGSFSHAFFRVFPFSVLDDDERCDAGGQCLQHTRDSGDGPVILSACFVATVDDQPVGAISWRPSRLDSGGVWVLWSGIRCRPRGPLDASAEIGPILGRFEKRLSRWEFWLNAGTVSRRRAASPAAPAAGR